MARVKIPTAADIMQRRPVTVRPDSDVESAVHLLRKKGYSGAPVVDAEGRLQGVLSEHDCIQVLSQAVTEGWPSGLVAHHMSKEIETVAPGDDACALATRFAEGRHRRLLVVDDGRLVGLISRHDLMKALEDTLEKMDRAGGKSTYEMIDERRRALD